MKPRAALMALWLLPAACSSLTVPRESGPEPGKAGVQRLARVAHRILPQFPASRCESFTIRRSWTPNASIRPGGQIEITTGLMALCASDDQLAFVLAHELAHEALHHARRRMGIAWLQALAAGAVAWAVEESSGSRSDAALAGGGVFLSSSLLLTLPALRRMETEADLAARDALQHAGYRPAAAAEFWRRYARARPSRELPAWLSDHPPDAARARRLEVP